MIDTSKSQLGKGKIRSICRISGFILLIVSAIGGMLIYTGIASKSVADSKRVIVLGFDGMDFAHATQWINEGKLPNLKRLRDKGILSPLKSTIPPESPVAWSAMVTGTNPGKTGVFDFLRRNPDTYFPELNMTDIVEPVKFMFDTIPVKAPVMRNARRGDSFWKYAGDAGVKTVGLMMPMNMPPEEAEGTEVFSGLGVPDMRRTMGTYVYYVDDIDVAIEHTGATEGTEMGGRVIEVIRKGIETSHSAAPSIDVAENNIVRNGNEIETFLPGPFDPLNRKINDKDELRSKVTMTVNPEAGSLAFRIFNQTPFKFMIFFGGAILGLILMFILWAILARSMKSNARGFLTAIICFAILLVVLGFVSRPTNSVKEVTVKEGQWSEWIPFKQLVTKWVGIEGFFRLYLIDTDPNLQLYVTPVCIDPRGTASAVLSYPKGFMCDLLDKYGYFKTYGWDSETWALNENVIDEDAFLEDFYENWDIKAELTLDLMKKDDWSLFAAVFQGTDHSSHMFWRFLDPEHPSYDEQAAQKYGDTILSVYQRADKMVGQVLDDVMKDGDSLIVMSDHGFNTWRKSLNLNKWLVDQGYLAEKQSVLSNIVGGEQKSSVYKLFSKGTEFFQWVDWSKSKAYALGLGQVYINLEGREKEGIVTANEKSALIDELVEKLKELRDPDTGEVVLSAVYRADKIYTGDNMEYAPDIVIGCAPGYRVSWQTTLGVAAEDLIEVNHKKWSGDHCSLDRESIPGVLFSTEPITVKDPELIDLTPSILSLFGIPKPERCDGRVIF